MTSDEEKMLALLLKKQGEEKAVAPVFQLIQGGGEKNPKVDKIDEFVAMARRGELYDYAIVVVMADMVSVRMAWGSLFPSLPLAAAVSALDFRIQTQLASTGK